MTVPRSYLYVPGDRRDRLARAPTLGADAVIADLEDAVLAGSKGAARANVAEWLREQRSPACELWVRINGTSLGEDLAAVVTEALTGVVLPKAQIAVVMDTDRLLTGLEASAQLPVGGVAVLALIETARGLLSAVDLASAPRVTRLGIGEADLVGELRLRPSEAQDELTSMRLQITLASAAAGIAAPVGPTSLDVRDLDALRRSTEALLRLGFRARTAIHPAQLPVVNAAFSPSAAEVAAAAQVVAEFEAAEQAGMGVLSDGRGRLVDVAVVRAARETLARDRPPAHDG